MRLFSSMGFQMCPQIACLREHKVTLVALMWLLSTMDYSNVPTNCLPARIQKHTSYIHLAFFHFRLFKCAHKLLGGEDKKLHKLHLSGFFRYWFSNVPSNCLPAGIHSNSLSNAEFMQKNASHAV